ncbi:MAG: DUF4924 family protein [Bacteroidaceae bacterium]|nr:DUF4924 family protein [Bacteroidaceae bacterium]
MKIAKELKEKNVCEYLLYMWQVEDTIRALGCDAERIRADYVSGFQLTDEERRREEEWMDNLCRMMHEEGRQEQGHLQINQATLSLMVDLHQQLLRSPKHPFYSAAYYKALPYIVELRARNNKEVGELEICLNGLYGVMLLRLQHKDVTAETQTALSAISHLLALLADAWNKEKQGTLEL